MCGAKVQAMIRTNELGQPIGEAVPGWTTRERPQRVSMVGCYCRLEPLDPLRHGAALHAAFAADVEGRNWTYLFTEPLRTREALEAWLTQSCMGDDPLYFTIIDAASNQAVGIASFMRIDPKGGVIEVGGIHYGEALKRTPAATEAMVLMMSRAFDELGYRRYEWKCDSLNAPSRAAALRLGFTYEGLFRQAVVYKGRNRDTAWYSITDTEWPVLKRAYTRWLDPGNLDAAGRQRERLSHLVSLERDG